MGNVGVVGVDEAKLWSMADALRNNMDAAEYKHVVLGLIFLKYISDAFEAKHAELASQRKQGADPEDPDEYRAASIFWVPKEARWSHLKASAPQPTIGKLVDDANNEYFLRPDLPNRAEAIASLLEDQDEYKTVSIFWVPKEARWDHLKANAPQPKTGSIIDDAISAIERDNPSLKGVLPKDYAPSRPRQAAARKESLCQDRQRRNWSGRSPTSTAARVTSRLWARIPGS